MKFTLLKYLILNLFLVCVVYVSGQTIKIPVKNQSSDNQTISSSSATIYIPRRIKIEKDVAKIDTIIKSDLQFYTKKMRLDSVISDNVQTSVNAKVVEETDTITNKQMLSLHVEYKYEVLKAKLENQTDDFPAGKYKLINSNAAKLTMQVLKQAVENQLSEYLTNNTKVTIKITGSTDAIPIINAIPYNNEYGEFKNIEYFYNQYFVNF